MNISFCINTGRNEINHIKLLLKSLEVNLSSKDHEILVFIDSDNQGTFEWLLTQKSIFPNLKIIKNILPIPYGYQRNINEMFQLATNDIVSYLQSDMVVCKNYDIEILKYLQPGMVLCSTRIEPPLHGNSGEKITYDFGVSPLNFNLDAFTSYAESKKQDLITEYFFAPFTMYKSVWLSIGGHDTMFRRSREDSDILLRLVLNNTKIIQVWNALVYHFTCTTSRGVDWFNPHNTKAQERAQLQQTADSIELGRFVTKWGEFRHSLTKVKYYNVAAYIKGHNLNLANFAVIQSHFSTVYVDDVAIIDLIQELYDRQHTPANNLLNITASDWKEFGYMFNTTVASNRIKDASNILDEDVIITFNIDDVTPQLYESFIHKIQEIVDNIDDVGEYEYGPFNIKVNCIIDRASEKIVISNPSVKQEHLYTIH